MGSDGLHWYTNEAKPDHGKTTKEARELDLNPSVTGVLGLWPNYGLKRWVENQVMMSAYTFPEKDLGDKELAMRIREEADRKRDEAAEWGSIAHDLMEAYVLGKNPQVPDGFTHLAPAWFEWLDTNVDTVVSAEKTVVHSSGYGGTTDLIYISKLDGKRYMVDYKTRDTKQGKTKPLKPSFYDTQPMQLEAYSEAEREMTGEGAECIQSVIVSRNIPGGIWSKVYSTGDRETAWRRFNLCLAMWKEYNKFND